MMPAELATPNLFKIKVLWNKGSDVIIPTHEPTIKISSSSINIVDVVMWPNFDYCSISMREDIISRITDGFVRKTDFEGWTWFKVNNLGLPLGMALKFYSSLAKWLKVKVKQCSVKLAGGNFGTLPILPSWIGLKMNWQIPVLWKPLKRRNIGFIASSAAV